ncbi:MAG: GNAT family N-acetyltransferase [Roseiarcus sp.]
MSDRSAPRINAAVNAVVDLSADDLPSAHALSKAVSWPHRQEDWRLLFALGRGKAAFEGETLIGTAMWWPFGDDFATLGMVIVAPDRQGAGIGGRLMRAVLDAAGPRSIALNATASGQPLYEKLGFVAVGEIQQHQGRAVVSVAGDGAETLRPMDEEDWNCVAALDRAATGLDRRATLGALRSLSEGVVLLRDRVPHESGVAGFSLVRDFGRGKVIGPVVAPDVDGAKALIGYWLARYPGQFLRIDTRGDVGLGEWLAGSGLAPVASVVTMIRGKAPLRSGATRLFAVVSQALG